MKKFLNSAAAVAFVTTLGAGLAGAGVASQASAAASADDAAGLPPVIVTAQKREEAAQSIGVAVTVLSGQQLVNDGITNVNQLQYSTPNLSVTPAFGSGQPNFRLRGVGFDDYASNNTSTVGVYVDEVAYALPILTQGLLYDIDRVEVLRGPQGTLYGRNTTGGAVNFITGKPTTDPHGGLTAEYGRYGALNIQGYVSGPLADNVQGRVSAQRVEGGGWQHDRATGQSLGDADKFAIRGQLKWEPTTRLDLLANLHYANDDSEPTGLYLFKPLATGVTGIGAIPADTNHEATGWGGSSLFAQATGFPGSSKPFRHNESDGLDLTANYDLGFARLTSIMAYEHMRRREYNDWDASAAALAGVYFGSKVDEVSEELRLSSTSEGKLKWVVGAYVGGEDLKDNFISDFAQIFGFDALTSYRQKTATQSVFGQATYQLTDTVDIVGGLRVEHEKRELRNFKTTTLPVIGIGTGGNQDTDYTEPTGKLALEWKPAAGTLYYASFSRGIKSGGFTAYNTLSTSQLKPFDPEVLYAYEAGFKRDIGTTLRINGAAYYYDYNKQQVQSAVYDPIYGAVGVIKNADAHLWGAELEAQWKPVPQLYISQSLGYSTGEFTSFQDLDIAGSSAAGKAVYTSRNGQTEGYPHLSYSGAVSYEAALQGYTLTASTDYAYHDKVKPTLLGPVFNVDSYWLVNADLTLKPNGGPWSVSLWARNLFDERYDLTRNFFLGGIDIAAPGQPATYGVRLSYKY